MSKIQCDSMAQFIEVCAGLVKQGVVFEAYAYDLVIKPIGY